MNPFFDIILRAQHGGSLSHLPQASYLASDAFRRRVEFKGVSGLNDRIQASLFMLKALALHPDEAGEALRLIEHGSVRLRFFGTSNPVGDFDTPINTPEFEQLKAAIKANIGSRMFKAAKRVRHWRFRTAQRARHEDLVREALRQALDWPTPQDYKANRELAQSRTEQLCEKMRQRMAQVRNLRNERLAKLAREACPGAIHWISFLVSISTEVLIEPGPEPLAG